MGFVTAEGIRLYYEETRAGGRWQLGGGRDHVTSTNLTCSVTATATAPDTTAALDAAVAGRKHFWDTS